MSVAVAQDTVRCPNCGRRRIVSARQARRARNGEILGLCARCRGRGHAKDRDLRYWIHVYGGEIPSGVSPRELIASGGAPPDLVELARSIFPHG